MSDEVTDWLTQTALPLSCLTAGVSTADLQPLKHVLDGVRIVGLGEATHGTREFFQLKHRLLEFLVTELAFSALAMEASASAGPAVDAYVRQGTGDAAQVLAGLVHEAEEPLEFLDGRGPDTADALRLPGYWCRPPKEPSRWRGPGAGTTPSLTVGRRRLRTRPAVRQRFFPRPPDMARPMVSPRAGAVVTNRIGPARPGAVEVQLATTNPGNHLVDLRSAADAPTAVQAWLNGRHSIRSFGAMVPRWTYRFHLSPSCLAAGRNAEIQFKVSEVHAWIKQQRIEAGWTGTPHQSSLWR